MFFVIEPRKLILHSISKKMSVLSGVSGLSACCRFLKEKKIECEKFPIEWIGPIEPTLNEWRLPWNLYVRTLNG